MYTRYVLRNTNHEYLHICRWMDYYLSKEIEYNIVDFKDKSEINKFFFDEMRRTYDICLDNLIIEEMIFLEDTTTNE